MKRFIRGLFTISLSILLLVGSAAAQALESDTGGGWSISESENKALIAFFQKYDWDLSRVNFAVFNNQYQEDQLHVISNLSKQVKLSGLDSFSISDWSYYKSSRYIYVDGYIDPITLSFCIHTVRKPGDDKYKIVCAWIEANSYIFQGDFEENKKLYPVNITEQKIIQEAEPIYKTNSIKPVNDIERLDFFGGRRISEATKTKFIQNFTLFDDLDKRDIYEVFYLYSGDLNNKLSFSKEESNEILNSLVESKQITTKEAQDINNFYGSDFCYFRRWFKVKGKDVFVYYCMFEVSFKSQDKTQIVGWITVKPGVENNSGSLTRIIYPANLSQSELNNRMRALKFLDLGYG